MNKTITYTKIILMAAIPLMVIAKIYQLNKTDFDMDLLAKQLTPLQSHIKPNCTVGFYNNSNDPALFVEMQYVMAPQVISNKITPDTLLVIQFNNKPLNTFTNYRVIAHNQDNSRQISLITKNN
ncbi:hypothetical protein [Mucilaginibacter flavidus]|uniref:hypothetical protein n=1 Tax=Mucilaginibacter flavidus TaxID=2949309 RepID=UPI0020926707|nr:hypothetical protein [Mucilaginibacter flavidus]MCO5948748.1 hypothetical protein [Mucilaginibacter flavidus]